MKPPSFDAKAFGCALAYRMKYRRLAMRDVSKVSGVSASTICRCTLFKRPDVDSLAKLLAWLEMPFEAFVRAAKIRAPQDGKEVK